MYSPLQAFAAKPLSQADIVRHTDLTNRTAFGLVQACLEAEVPPGLVANVFLYYWLRASTIWRPFSLHSMLIPTPEVCPPMWNANCTTICSAASSRMVSSG